MDTSYRGKIDHACRMGEEFTKMYYETMDKRRHMLSRLYMDSAVLSWNGNGVQGNDGIQKYYIELPATDHKVITQDSQPIIAPCVGDQPAFMIQVTGHVRYQAKVPKTFQQNFIITAIADKWKVVTDCFRLQEPVDK